MKSNSFIKFFFFIILIYSNLTLADLKNSSSKNTDGIPSSSNSWPWMAVIYHSTGHDWIFRCGATLIDKKWILTTASCMKGVLAARNLLVIINEYGTDRKEGTVYRLGDEIVIHAEYSRHDNDYAMLKIREVPSSIKPIQLAPPYIVEDWNFGTAPVKDLSLDLTVKSYRTKLREVDQTIISNSLCSKNEKMSARYGKDWITDNMICAGQGLGKKDTCDGVSGGPLIIRDTTWMQLGVSSFGRGCAPYGVYARTSKITRWVSDLMCSNEEAPDIPSSLKFVIHNNNTVTFTWDSVSGATGYHLNYRIKGESFKRSVNLKKNYFTSDEIDSGKSFYVTINSYKDNCLSKETKEKHLIVP
jgi:trypsin